MSDMNHVLWDEDDQRQRMDWQDQQYELDLARAMDELYDFFNKAEHGMITAFDVSLAKENLKLFGVDIT